MKAVAADYFVHAIYFDKNFRFPGFKDCNPGFDC